MLVQDMQLLQALPRVDDSELVFPGCKPLRPLSDMSLSACMCLMGYKDPKGKGCVPHGCRSTFRDWALEKTTFSGDMAEMALAHTIDSAVEAAYRRGDMLAKRLKMMQSWADFCDAVSPTK